MINYLHSLIFRPENGWDPVPEIHVNKYFKKQWNLGIDEDLLDKIEYMLGGLAGKKVLDLGGGPGQYSIAFARRNACVTWYDISNRYKVLVKDEAIRAKCSIKYKIGYMDEADKILNEQFDLVFNRICWNYAISDKTFAKTIFKLINPGGFAYIDTSHSLWGYKNLSLKSKLKTFLNNKLCFLIIITLTLRI